MNNAKAPDQFADYRARHHYFAKLRFWNEYVETFAYLDSKSQGLTAVSGLGAVVFSVFIDGSKSASTTPDQVQFWLAVVGFVLLIITTLLLLKCYRATANITRDEHFKEVSKFEAYFPRNGWRREALIENFIDQYTSMVTEYRVTEQNRIKNSLKVSFQECWRGLAPATVVDQNFDDLLDDIESLFVRLRGQVEQEVESRRKFYKWSRMLIMAANVILLLLLSLICIEFVDPEFFTD